MKFVLLLSAFLVLGSSIMIPHIGPATGKPLPIYNVDIDAPLRDQWAPILKDFKTPFAKFIHDFRAILPFPDSFYAFVGKYAKHGFKFQRYVEEIEIFSELLEADFNILFTLNLLYEIQSGKACTSIVFRDENGRIIHGRNWDFEFWYELAHISFQINYHKNGELFYQAQAIAGAVFFFTAQKPGKFAVSINARHTKTFLNNIYELLFTTNVPALYLVREFMETVDTYDEAVLKFKTTPTVDPVYYIVSGPGLYDGTVIEKDRDFVKQSFILTDETWFLVQTNYDRDIPDPKHDERRTPAEQRMAQYGQSLTEQGLLDDVLSIFPNFNIATISSTLMSTQTGYFNNTVWY
ncbi:hypothetical protein ABPG74_013227 [Tetrahymena malaccensis]